MQDAQLLKESMDPVVTDDLRASDVKPSGSVVQLTQNVRPLKICLLGYRSNPYGGGQGIYIKYLSKALVNAGHSVDVISGQPYPEVEPGVNLIKMPGLDLYSHFPHHIRALRPRHFKSLADLTEWASMATGGFSEAYSFGRRVVAYLKEHGDQYDLVHDNQSLCTGLLTLQEMGLPTIATVHHPITRDLKIALDAAPWWWDRVLIRRWHSFLRMNIKVVQKLNHIITVSEQSKGDIAEAFEVPEEDITLVYNGIDTDVFCPQPEVSRKPYRLMATASADQPLKGLKFLIEALADLSPRYPNIELLVIGKPKEGGYTERLIKRLGIEDRITFRSGISTEELVKCYAESTIAVVPSLYEGFGLPAGEAMACGIPTVSTTGGALPEVVGDAGVLVPPSDRQALATAISQLLDDPAEREALGKAGRKQILEKFCWNVCAQQMTEYYYQVLDYANS